MSREGYALIVGVSRYRKKNSFSYVSNAMVDSKQIASVLEKHYKVKSFLAIDAEATKENIIKNLKYVISICVKSSKFIFIFTGKIEGSNFCCYNYHRKKRNTTALSFQTLDEHLSRIVGRDKIVVINAKYSAKVFDDIQSADLLCSQSVKEKLWLEEGHGIFIKRLCEVLKFQCVRELFSVLDLMDVLGAFLPREKPEFADRVKSGDLVNIKSPAVEKTKVNGKEEKEEENKDQVDHLFHPILACRDEEHPFFFSQKTQELHELEEKKRKVEIRPFLNEDKDEIILTSFDGSNRSEKAVLIGVPELKTYSLIRSRLMNSVSQQICSSELSSEDKSERGSILRSISVSLLIIDEEDEKGENSVLDKKVLILQGKLGFGKTYCSLMIARNYDVVKSFDFIFYFNVGKEEFSETHNIVRCQKIVISEFNKEEAYFDTIEKGKSLILKYLKLLKPKVLIILDDLNSKKALEAFYIDHDDIEILVTCDSSINATNYYSFIPKEKRKEYTLGELNEFDCIVLFSEILEVESFRIQSKIAEELGPVRRIFDLCRYQPLCLFLLGTILSNVDMSEYDFRIRTIENVVVPPLDKKYFSLRHDFLYKTIYKLIGDMEEMDRDIVQTRFPLYESFLSLTLIPNYCIYVPITIVKIYFEDEKITATYQKIQTLSKIGLIRIKQIGNELCINVHKIILEVLRSITRKYYSDIQVNFVKRLVNYICVDTKSKKKTYYLNNAKWWLWNDDTKLNYDMNYENTKSVLGKHYILKHITHHLREGKITGRYIENLLLSIDWYIQIYSNFKSFDSILGDFRNLEGFPHYASQKELPFLYSAFTMSLPVISSRVNEMEQQFLGRLGNSKFDKLRLFVNRLRSSMFEKLYPYATQFTGVEVPSPKTFDIFFENEGKIDILECSIDSLTILALSKENKSIIIWDIGDNIGKMKERIDVTLFHGNKFINNCFLKYGIGKSLLIALDDSVYRRVAVEDDIFQKKQKFKKGVSITSFTCTRDHFFFICATSDLKISYHSIADGKILREITVLNIITALTVFGAGNSICYGDCKGEVGVYNIDTQKEKLRYNPHPGYCINKLAVGFEKYVISCASDNRIIMCDLNTSYQREFIGHTDAVSEIQLSIYSDWLVSYGWDGRIILWDIVSGNKISQFIINQNEGIVNSLIATPNRKWIFVGIGSRISAYDFKLKRIDFLKKNGEKVTSNIVVFKDNRSVVYGTVDGRVRFKDIDALTDNRVFYCSGLDQPVLCVSVTNRSKQISSIDDEIVAVVYKNDELVRVWKVSTGKLLKAMNPYGEVIYNLFWWSKSLFVSSGGIWPNEEVRIWDIRSGETKEILMRQRKVFDIVVSSVDKGIAPYVVCQNIYGKLNFDIDLILEPKEARRKAKMSRSMVEVGRRKKPEKRGSGDLSNSFQSSGLMKTRSGDSQRVSKKFLKANMVKTRSGDTTTLGNKSKFGRSSKLAFALGNKSKSGSLNVSQYKKPPSPKNSFEKLPNISEKPNKFVRKTSPVRRSSNKENRSFIPKNTPNTPSEMKRSKFSNSRDKLKFSNSRDKLAFQKTRLYSSIRKIQRPIKSSLPKKVNSSIFSTVETKEKNGVIVASSSTYYKRKAPTTNSATALPGRKVSDDIFSRKKRKGGKHHSRTKSSDAGKIAESRSRGVEIGKRGTVRHLADMYDQIEGKDIRTLRVDHQFTVCNLKTQMIVSQPYPSRNKLSRIFVEKSNDIPKSYIFGYVGEKVLRFNLETMAEDVVLFCSEERRIFKTSNCITNIQCSKDGGILVVVFDKNVITLYIRKEREFQKRSTYTVKERVKSILIMEKRNSVYIICSADELVFLKYVVKQ